MPESKCAVEMSQSSAYFFNTRQLPPVEHIPSFRKLDAHEYEFAIASRASASV